MTVDTDRLRRELARRETTFKRLRTVAEELQPDERRGSVGKRVLQQMGQEADRIQVLRRQLPKQPPPPKVSWQLVDRVEVIDRATRDDYARRLRERRESW